MTKIRTEKEISDFAFAFALSMADQYKKRCAKAMAKKRCAKAMAKTEKWVDFRCDVPIGLMPIISEISTREQIDLNVVWKKFISEAYEELSNTNARIKENLGA